MASILDDLEEFNGQLDKINNNLSGNSTGQGFESPVAPTADINLPFNKIPTGIPVPKSRRQLIHWFIPDMGVVKMYVNPNQIVYTYKKIQKTTRTKGGYSVQYWGEELPTLQISGNTGSSGIEGINALYEVYRAEQYTFDSVGLTLSSNNAAQNVANNILGYGVSKLSSSISNGIGGVTGGVIGGAASALLSPSSSSLPTSIPSLANTAFTVEMYYMGWVFRGFFTTMTVTEKANDFSIEYNLGFTVTQKRGYRTNYLPWQKNPSAGGSDLGNNFEGPTDRGTATSPYYSFRK